MSLSRVSAICLLLAAAFAPSAWAEAWDAQAQSAEIATVLQQRDGILADLNLVVPVPSAIDTAAPRAAPPETTDLVIVGSDVRLALTQLALSAGSEGHNAVLAAQPGFGAPGLYIRSGAATLEGLYAEIQGSKLEPVLRRNRNGYVLSRPIVVLKGASLSIGPDETVSLDRDGGALLLSFGQLSITGATIKVVASDVETDPEAFRPFVASVGSGSLQITDSKLSGLGFDGSDAMTGVAVATGGLFRSEIASLLRSNHFDDIGGITVNGGAEMRIEGNLLEATRGIGLNVRNSNGILVRRNVVREAIGDDAMRFAGAVDRAEISDNAFAGGRHAGLRIEDAAANLRVTGNLFTGYRSHGIIVQDGAICITISSNIVTDNRGGAIEIIRSGPIQVSENAVLDNRGPGISVSGEAAAGQVTVQHNVFTDNRSGIRSASGHLFLSGNNMKGQLPRLYSGDLAQFTGPLLRATSGSVAGDVTIHRATLVEGKVQDAAAGKTCDQQG